MAERFNDESKRKPAIPRRDAATPDGRTTSQDPVLDLQRKAGNRAVSDLLQGRSAATSGPSPALRLRDALRVGRGVAQRELSLNVQRAMNDDDKKDPAEATFGGEDKVAPETEDKLGGEEKVAPETEDELGGEDKMPSDEEKMPPESEDKMPSGDGAGLFDDEEKFA
jgi:hypothetical protein